MYKRNLALLLTTLILTIPSKASEQENLDEKVLKTLSKEEVQNTLDAGWHLIDQAEKNQTKADPKAEVFFSKALEGGNPHAIMGLLKFYSDGTGCVKPEYREKFKILLNKSIENKKTTKDRCLERDERLLRGILLSEEREKLIESGIKEGSLEFTNAYYKAICKVDTQKLISHYGSMAQNLNHQDTNEALRELLSFQEEKEALRFLVQAYIVRKDPIKACEILEKISKKKEVRYSYSEDIYLRDYLHQIEKINTDPVIAFKLVKIKSENMDDFVKKYDDPYTKTNGYEAKDSYLRELKKLKNERNFSFELVGIENIDNEISQASKRLTELSTASSSNLCHYAKMLMSDDEIEGAQRFSEAADLLLKGAQNKEFWGNDCLNEILNNPKLIEYLKYDDVCQLFMKKGSFEGLKLLMKNDSDRAPLLLFFLNSQKFKNLDWAWEKEDKFSNLDLIQWEDSTKRICDSALQGYLPAMIFYSEFIEGYLERLVKMIEVKVNPSPEHLKGLEEWCQKLKKVEKKRNLEHNLDNCLLCSKNQDVYGSIVTFEENCISTRPYEKLLIGQEAVEKLESFKKILNSHLGIQKKIVGRISNLTTLERDQLGQEFKKLKGYLEGFDYPISWSAYEKKMIESSENIGN